MKLALVVLLLIGVVRGYVIPGTIPSPNLVRPRTVKRSRAVNTRANFQEPQAAQRSPPKKDVEFVPFKTQDGEYSTPLKRQFELDVGMLNSDLQQEGVDRSSTGTKNSLSAYAVIFNIDTLVDFSWAHFIAWHRTASKWKQPVPSEREILQGMSVAPARFIMSLRDWTLNPKESSIASEDFLDHLNRAQTSMVLPDNIDPEDFHREINKVLGDDSKQERALAAAPKLTLKPGVRQWLQLLEQENVPVAVVGSQNSKIMLSALAYLKIPIQNVVGADDGHDTMKQMLLATTLQTKRPPERSVLIDNAPRGAIASHEAGMRNFCVMGVYPAFDLTGADRTISSMNELNQQSIFGMFSDVNLSDSFGLELKPELEQEAKPVKRRPVAVLDRPSAHADAHADAQAEPWYEREKREARAALRTLYD